MSYKIGLDFDRRKTLLFSLSMLVAFSGSVSAYEKPNITEVQDSFGDTYEIDNDAPFFDMPVSDREIRFDRNESIEMCVTEIEHEENADLEFKSSVDYHIASDKYDLEDRCLTLNLTEERYSDPLRLRIRVNDNNPSRTLTDYATIEYNNTVDPLENEGGQETSTEYDYSLIETERKNELEQRVSDLNSTVQNQKSEIENLEDEISDKDEQIASLEQEISKLKSGISGIIVSVFS